MAITEVQQGLGGWTLRLRPDTPQSIVDQFKYFSLVAITDAREDIRVTGDAVLDSARYVGVYRGDTKSSEGLELKGASMALFLGDEDDKGAVIEEAITFTGSTFTSAVSTLLALQTTIQAGTLYSVTGTYSSTHVYQSVRKALDYLTSTMDAEWRVNNNGTLDAGLETDLYPSTPRAGIFAKARGTGGAIKALPGKAKISSDVEDFTSRVLYLGSSSESVPATEIADIGVNPYVDFRGQPVKMTRIVSESTTSSGNAAVRAQLQLNRFVNPRDAITLNSTTHDVSGSIRVGEYAYVYDPDAGLYDNNTELQWQGEILHPVKLRVTAMTWPVEEGRGVYFRTPTGAWLDLSPFVTYESGQTNVTVGGYNRSLVSTGSEPVSVRTPTVQPNTSIPAAPTWTTPFTTSVYQSSGSGTTRAQVRLDWAQPLNIDSTAIIDGDFYEIRYRTTSEAILPATHQQMSAYTHDALNTHDRPIPFTTSGWAYVRAPWDVTEYVLSELQAGTPYEFQIRAFDNGTPPNPSAWSTSVITQTGLDNQAPETPAAPYVTGNPVSVQVESKLGSAAGGDWNLSPDLNHLEVHAQYEPTFEPILLAPENGGTLIGKLRATSAEINGHIPAIDSFPIKATGPLYVKIVAVDDAGNRSRPSAAAPVTPGLVEDQHVSNLTASKITAGTLTAAYTLSGFMTTGTTAGTNRAYMSGTNGFYTYNSNDQLTFWAGGPNGTAYIKGTITTGEVNTRRIAMDPGEQSLSFYPNTSAQRYVVDSFTSDQIEDLADTPGIRLYGINEAGQVEGAYLTLWEDGWSVSNQDAGGTTTSGGFAFGTRSALVIGKQDSAGTSRLLQMDSTLKYFPGTATSSGTFELTTGFDGGATVYSPGVRLYTAAVDGGGAIYAGLMRYASTDDGSNARFQFTTGSGSAWTVLEAGAFTVSSDRAVKSNIVDADMSALEMVRKTKVKKYTREPVRPERTKKVKDESGKETIEFLGPDEDAVLPDPPEEIGLIAQEAPAEIVVGNSGDSGLGINLYAMGTLTWKAVQELDEENRKLRERLDTLEKQMTQVLAALKTQQTKEK